MPADALTTPSDSGPDMARYNELMGKANLLYGQGQKVAEVAGQLNTLVAGIQWEGKRADRFREEWDKTRAMLSGWANDLVNLSEEVRAEAENILVE
jgi:uncharacterized protein YukE